MSDSEGFNTCIAHKGEGLTQFLPSFATFFNLESSFCMLSTFLSFAMHFYLANLGFAPSVDSSPYRLVTRTLKLQHTGILKRPSPYHSGLHSPFSLVRMGRFLIGEVEVCNMIKTAVWLNPS